MPADVVQTESFPTTVQGPAGGDARTATSVRAMGSPLASRTKWTWNRLQELLGTYKKITNVDTGTSTIASIAHGLSDDDPVGFRAIGSGAALPTGLNAILYAQVVDADNFQVSTTVGGSALTLVDQGLGDLYVAKLIDGANFITSFANGGVLPLGSLRSQLAYIVANFARLAVPQTWGGLQTFAKGITFNNASQWTGIAYRVKDDYTDASQTIQPIVDESVLAAPAAARTITVGVTPTPTEGFRWRLVRPKSGAFDITIQRIGAAAIALLPASTGTHVDLIYRSGNWHGSAAGDGVAADPAGW